MRAEAHRVGESLRESLIRRHGADVEDVVGVKADDVVPLVLARGVEQRSAGDHEPLRHAAVTAAVFVVEAARVRSGNAAILGHKLRELQAGGFRIEFLTRNAENDARRVAHDEQLALGRAVCDGDELHAVVRRFRPALRGGGDADERGVDRFGLVVFGALALEGVYLLLREKDVRDPPDRARFAHGAAEFLCYGRGGALFQHPDHAEKRDKQQRERNKEKRSQPSQRTGGIFFRFALFVRLHEVIPFRRGYFYCIREDGRLQGRGERKSLRLYRMLKGRSRAPPLRG